MWLPGVFLGLVIIVVMALFVRNQMSTESKMVSSILRVMYIVCTSSNVSRAQTEEFQYSDFNKTPR